MKKKDDDTKKAAVRSGFREYVRLVVKQDLGKLNKKQQSWALIQYYISEIYNPLRNLISDDDVERGLVDGSNDLEVDFIHRDNNSVLILQAKYCQEGASEPAKDIEHFQGVFERLLDPKFKKNSKLEDALAEVDFEADTFDLRYITLGRVTGQAKEQADREPRLPSEYSRLRDRIQFEVLDETHLTEELRNALSLESGIPGKWELVAHGPRRGRSRIVELDAGGYRSCVLVVSATQIIELYKRYRDSLFTVNIRNYIGNTATNKGIIESARGDAPHFFHFNNGISCLARRVSIGESGDRLEVEGLQVINGAQTVKALFRASQQKGIWSPPMEPPLVLMRITEVEKGYGPEGEFSSNVIRYNNTQNVIKVSDFRSNDAVQNDLKRKFEDLFHGGRRIDYVPKRTDRLRSNSVVVRLEEFSKVVYSFVKDPIAFAGNSSFLFDDGESGGYRHVFGDGKQVWMTMPEAEFRLRAAVWWMAEAFSERRKDDRAKATDPAERGALERKWMLIYTTRLILERSFVNEGYRGHLSRFYRGEWKLGEGADGRWFGDLYEKAKGVVVYVYGQAMKGEKFVHRNWVRSADTVRDLQDFVRRVPGMTVDAPGAGK